jgi:hypothetical protein
MGRLRLDSIEGDFLEQAADGLWRNWGFYPRKLHSGPLGWRDAGFSPVRHHRGHRGRRSGVSPGQGAGFVLNPVTKITSS